MKKLSLLLVVTGMIGCTVYGAEQTEPLTPRTAALKSALAILKSKPLTQEHRDLLTEIHKATGKQLQAADDKKAPAKSEKKSKTKSQPRVVKPSQKAIEQQRSTEYGEWLFDHLLRKSAISFCTFFEPMREKDPELYMILFASKMEGSALILAPLLKEDKKS
jgi:hypothetical protein